MMACVTPYYTEVKGKYVPVGCGRCPQCKKRRVEAWAFRLMQEEKVSTSCYFITLTYGSEHVPINEYGERTLVKSIVSKEEEIVDKLTGEIKIKKHWIPHPKSPQAFIKRLRKKQKKYGGKPIKYYCVGEYGEKKGRPHYHLILFNLEGAKYLGVNVDGYAKFYSKDVEEAWNMGRVDVGQGSGNSAAYCAKYIDKSCAVGKEEGDTRLPKFSVMSKGLGSEYISENTRNYHTADLERTYTTDNKGHRIAMPRYYRERIYTEEEREAQREIAGNSIKEEEKRQRQRVRDLYKQKMHPEDWNYEKRNAIFESYEKRLKKDTL